MPIFSILATYKSVYGVGLRIEVVSNEEEIQ